MPTYEGLRLKVLKFKRKNFADSRRKKLNNTDFTIISNNCWGGMIYESYNLKKLSPTVGLFFMAPDYIKFVSDLRGYLNGTLTFIKPGKSRWADAPQVSGDSRFGTYPVGVLSNGKEEIEIFFLHYHDEQQVKEKWARRCQRVNFENMLVKFNDQNGCTEDEIQKFAALNLKNKIFFTSKAWKNEVKYRSKIKNYYRIKQFSKSDSILASYEPFGKSKYVDITEVLNDL